MAGTVTVMVVVVPTAISRDVVCRGIEIVVVDGRARGGSTKRQGAVHCAGVPVYASGAR